VWLREFGNHGPPSLQNWCLVIHERKGVDSGQTCKTRAASY
jgi:hypothetical protein